MIDYKSLASKITYDLFDSNSRKKDHLYEFNPSTQTFQVRDDFSQSKKDILEFQNVVKKYFKLNVLLHQEIDIEKLNTFFRNEMCEIDIEYDHVHFPELDIQYYVNEKFNLFFNITDAQRQWKNISTKEEIKFTIDVSNDFTVTSNATLGLSAVPENVHHGLLCAYNHISNNILNYKKALLVRVNRATNDIIHKEFAC